MQEITLSQMLEAREKRADLQKEFIRIYNCPLICFTMNIAGPIKHTSLIERAFKEGLSALDNTIPAVCIRERRINIAPTGCEAFFAVAMDAKSIKEICIAIEDACPLGRLYDIDVLDVDAKKLERKTMRGCIVCSAPGRFCAAGRVHSVSDIQKATYNIIREHFLEKDCKRIAELATKSLLQEVYTTPKPGLVDSRNNGSHTDMNISTFEKSANALTPYFYNCVAIGQRTKNAPYCETFALLKNAGIIAEEQMYQATNNINTHKGAIYSIGVICGAIGRLWKPETPIAKTEEIFLMCAELVNDAVKEYFSSIDCSTNGGRLYIEHGIKGIRGEVATGFPSVLSIGLPAYQKALESGLSSNDAGVLTLLQFIANIEDTNLYHRGGIDGAHYAADYAKNILRNAEIPSLKSVEKMDDDFISKNLSPGGCADLLAVTYLLYELKNGL